ncbi:hypothetical protein Adt_47861 [Abeliophyllum distichum]|uniref:Uncharacterized protein n=1 Tax=Abeliophyllum distichum TaxID=126358 RepID=A0ABD1NSN8_9LAMI
MAIDKNNYTDQSADQSSDSLRLGSDPSREMADQFVDLNFLKLIRDGYGSVDPIQIHPVAITKYKCIVAPTSQIPQRNTVGRGRRGCQTQWRKGPRDTRKGYRGE